MTIKEMEARTGLTRANIRFYEAEGLITPERRPNGYRDYSEEDLAVLQRVKLLRSLHMSLEEIKIANTNAAFEPRLDYVIAKLPRFPFDKFASATNKLGTQMKATGEVMGIGSNLEEALLKGMRSLEIGVNHVYLSKFDNMIFRCY